MKKLISKLLLLSSALTILTFSACTKNDDTNNNLDDAGKLAQQSDDQGFVTYQVDETSNDINTAIEENPLLSGRTTNGIYNATITLDSTVTDRILTITYNGANLAGTFTRTGSIRASIPKNKKWKDAGTVVTVSYQSLKITRVVDNKSITLNGSQTITNVSGGRLINLSTLGTITHKIESNGLSITFDDATQRAWQVAKQRVFTYNNGVVISTTGTHTQGNITGISEWGTNRFGVAFTTQIVTPLVIRQDCAFRLTSGKVVHNGFLRDVTVTFGLNAQGNATSCPGTGYYYLKSEWTDANGGIHIIIHPY